MADLKKLKEILIIFSDLAKVTKYSDFLEEIEGTDVYICAYLEGYIKHARKVSVLIYFVDVLSPEVFSKEFKYGVRAGIYFFDKIKNIRSSHHEEMKIVFVANDNDYILNSDILVKDEEFKNKIKKEKNIYFLYFSNFFDEIKKIIKN